MRLVISKRPRQDVVVVIMSCVGPIRTPLAWITLRLAWVALLCGSVLGLSSFAADPSAPAAQDLVIRSWAGEAGLPQNTINDILQTREGYLWLATRDGLARFDGVRFTVFGLREGLPSVDVSALFQDRHGTMWVGTLGGGLCRWWKGRFEPIPGGDGTINALAEDFRGRLWIGLASGLMLREGGRFVPDKDLVALAGAPIRTFLCDREGAMWIATANQGLFRYKDGRLTLQEGPAEDQKISAYCLLQDKRGWIWASVGNGKVLCLQNGQWHVYNQADGLPFAYVTSLAVEADGTVWAGSLDDGLYRFNGERFGVVRKEDGLAANDIRSLFPDREGNLWVGTRTGGLSRLSRRKLIYCGAAQGLTNDFTRSVAQAPDGTFWVATTGGGLYHGTPQGFAPFGPEPVIRYYAQAESVLARADGSLWWGGARALLCWQDGKLTGCFTNQPWVGSASIQALCDDRHGGLWIGTSMSRLVHYENGSFQEFPHRVGRGPIVALAQLPDGFLWVGSAAGGLVRIREGSDEVLSVTNGLISQSIRALYLDGQGTLWAGTAGGGLVRRRNGHLDTFTAAQGLGANTVSQIVEDDFGCLWLGCNRGIVRVRKTELEDLAAGKIAFLHPKAYGLNDGMPAEECSSGFCPAGLKTRSGLVCFSTVRGLVFLDPSQQSTNAPPPEVLIEETLSDGKPQPVLDPQPDGRTPFRRVLIRPGVQELEVHYTGISFTSPEKLTFRYRLDGLDRDWVEAGVRRTAYYHRPPPGRLVFRVRACNADGVWSKRDAALAITIQPYIWQTVWFQAGAALAGLALFAGALRFSIQKRYRRRLAQLQTQHAVEKERLRIAQDMHDHIGGMLTQVSQLSDLGLNESAGAVETRTRFERIGSQSRAAVQALDEIIWATNPKNDDLPHFAEYVSRFADEFFDGTLIRCWQDMPADLPCVPLRAEVRHNVFLAFREALNNVLKHSGATEVWLRISLRGAELTMEIEDNGHGFAATGAGGPGNGLENMRARLAECGGRAEWNNASPRGARVRFIFPLNQPEDL